MKDFNAVKPKEKRNGTGLGGILLIIFALLLAIVMVGVGVLWWWYQSSLAPVGGGSEIVNVVIPRGSSTEKIGSILKDEGLIQSVWGFRIYARREGLDGSFQAGSYRLSADMNVAEIAEKLQTNADGVWVTLVEGWRREEIGLALDKAFAGANESWSLEDFLTLTDGKEGFLYPDTYLMPKLITTEAVVNLLETTFEEKTAALRNENLPLELSFDDVVILASLLEREAARDVDLPIIAGIFLNRVEQGWHLNVDATLQYIKVNESSCVRSPRLCDDWWPIPLASDKEFDSPLNTYLYTGIPPRAIANPSYKAMEAIVFPDETEYMFYLTDNSGNMHYTITYDDHINNINRYLR